MNSRTNIEKANNLAIRQLIRHQLGGDLGGPVFRELFFFGLYQRDSQRQPNAQPDDHPDPDAGRLCGAPERAAARRPVCGEPAGVSCSRSAFLQDVYSASPVFLNNQLVNGVPIETGQTNVSILDPSMYHTWLGRDVSPDRRAITSRCAT